MKFLAPLPLFLVLFFVALSPAHEPPVNPAFVEVNDTPGLPRVLLLGDSISIGYTANVRERLAGKANVHRALVNCGPTTHGLEKLDEWLGDRTWDVIHFNFGLHDIKYIDDAGQRVPPAQGHMQVPAETYRKNLTVLIGRMKATRAKLIWCSTTPVPEGAHGRVPGDEIKYNEIAAEVVKQASPDGEILTNDLFEFAKQRLETIQQKADVHFTKEGSIELGGQVASEIESALEIQKVEPQIARGVVFHDANGNQKYDPSERVLPEMRVSNGKAIVLTDSHGRYEIPVSQDAILFVIKPTGWRTPVDENQLPQFYYIHKPHGSPASKYPGVDPTGVLPRSIDFPLYPQKEPEQFKAILFGDPQPRTQKEVDYMAHDVIEDLIGTDASLGVTLGDIVYDDLSLFESQARAIAVLGIPWYNVIGNHDINYDAKDDKHSDETFERHFGPAYYAFDYGKVHFLVLDDVEWVVQEDGKSEYRGGLGEEQMAFIRRDLDFIDDDRLVVLLMHIPLVNVHNRQELFRLIEQRPFCMSISAHRHTHEHVFITREDGWKGPQPHHHVVNVTVSGSWWQGQADERGIPHTTMADGAPNGYSIISFDGSKYRLDFRAAGRAKDYQMNIYAPEVVKTSELDTTPVHVNFFNGSPRSKLEIRIDSSEWKLMEHVKVVDPAFKKITEAEKSILAVLKEKGVNESELWAGLTGAKESSHIWRATLPELKPGVRVIRIRATDMNGQVFHDERLMRIQAE